MLLSHSDQLHISELNVMNKEVSQDFIFDCDIIIPGGTLSSIDIKDAKRHFFDPTLIGTENFLEVISKTHGIEKIVFIASVAAWNTNFPISTRNKSFTDSFDENDLVKKELGISFRPLKETLNKYSN